MRCLETARFLVITLVLSALIALVVVLATLHKVDSMSASASRMLPALTSHGVDASGRRRALDAGSWSACPNPRADAADLPPGCPPHRKAPQPLTPGQEGNFEMTSLNSDDRWVTREGGLGRDQPLPAHFISAVEDAFRRLRAGDVQMIGLPVPSIPHTAPTR